MTLEGMLVCMLVPFLKELLIYLSKSTNTTLKKYCVTSKSAAMKMSNKILNYHGNVLKILKAKLHSELL